MNAMLQVDGISKNFGGLKALDNCSMNVEQGSITALIGPNGSGKTTLFNVITGFLEPNGGSVRFEGHEVTGLPVYRIANLGIGRTFQVSSLFPKLTVWENLLVAYPQQIGESLFSVFTTPWRIRIQDEEQMVRAQGILERIGLAHKVEEPAANLSAPEARMLEIGRQLMFSPRLMLLDEPSSGVNPAMLDRLAEMITDLNKEGMTFLIIGHNLSFIMKLSHYLHVLQYGKLIASGPPQTVARDKKVIEAYMGVRQ
ncbi:MAG TPA: ABC transporter ATP-binding protein [Anaerolineales bacterium]